jgi:hypothetical protein
LDKTGIICKRGKIPAILNYSGINKATEKRERRENLY